MSETKRFIHIPNHEGGDMVEAESVPEFCGSDLYVLASAYDASIKRNAELEATVAHRENMIRLCALGCNAVMSSKDVCLTDLGGSTHGYHSGDMLVFVVDTQSYKVKI